MKIVFAILFALTGMLGSATANAEEFRISHQDLLVCPLVEGVCIFAADGRSLVLFPVGQQVVVAHSEADSPLPAVLLTPAGRKADLSRLLSQQLIDQQEPDVGCAKMKVVETCYEADGTGQVLVIFSAKIVEWQTATGFMGRIPYALSVPELPVTEIVSQ